MLQSGAPAGMVGSIRVPKGNKDFKARVKDAVDAAREEYGCLPLQGQELFTAVNRHGGYGWIHLMDTDGLLICERTVGSSFDGETPANTVKLVIGVAVQSEDKTALTKPNPLGKASVGKAALGVWADRKSANGRERVRIDRLFVLFVVPESIGNVGEQKKKEFDMARRAVENAADVSEDCRQIVVPRGISGKELNTRMIEALRGTLRGKGRPPGKD